MNIKQLSILLFIFTLSACSTQGGRVKDFSDRSVAFGWVDISDVKANKLHAVQLKQFQVPADKGYWNIAVEKFKGGFLFYHIGLPAGAFKLKSISGQSCLLLCSNTIYVYDFGSQGEDIGGLIIKKPGVYSLGKYKLAKRKTGFFKPGEFDVSPAKGAPSNKEILEFIFKQTDEPVVQQRIKRAINAL